MSDFPDDLYNYEDLEPEDNPFYGLGGFDEFSETDPYEKLEKDVLDSLGIEEFDEIIFDIKDVDVENLRGNRFESLGEALTYLFDSGILRFSGIVIDDDEISIEIDSDTGGSTK